jgi:hypothetical protein
VRLLQGVVIGLGVLFVIALVGVVAGVVMKRGGHAAAAAGGAYALPPGAAILDMRSEPGRLVLRLKTKQGEEIDIVDTADGHLVARIR